MPLLPPNPTLADRFFWLVECMFHATSTENYRRQSMDGKLAFAMGRWARRLRARLAVLYAQWKAGTLPPARRRCGRSARPADQPRPPSVLPRAFRWLHRLFPDSAPECTGVFFALLDNEPEMAAFVAAVPQAGRLLRPYCNMLGLKPPEWLALPRHARARKQRDKPPPHPDAARLPDQPAARSAAKALARAAAGKPVDVTKLSAVAYGYIVHPPRNQHCPPLEIGYARARPPPLHYPGHCKNRA